MIKNNLKSISLTALCIAGATGMANPAFAQAAGGTGPGDPVTEVCTQSTASNSLACGNRSTAGSDSTAIGVASSATGGASTAIGGGSAASGPESVALGVFASAPTRRSVALGAGSRTDQDFTVSVGNSGASGIGGVFQRRIVNVAAGTGQFDAVNVNQLNAVVSAQAAVDAGQNTRLTTLEALNNGSSARVAALETLTGNFGGRISNLELESRQATGGIAAALALGGAAIVPDSNISMSFNLSTYHGQQGFSGSVIGRVAEKVYISGGVAGSTVKGSTGGRVGVTFGF